MGRAEREPNSIAGVPYIHVTELAGRKVDLWVPDTTNEAVIAEIQRQCILANQSPFAEEDQAFVDSISVFWDE